MKKKTYSVKTSLDHTSSSNREAFRLESEEIEANIFNFLGKPVGMINLSAGGVSFHSCKFKPGDKGPVTITMTLPAPATLVIEAELQILSISGNNICHCRFTKITEEAKENIHKFILNRQISRLRTKKKGINIP